MNIKVAFAPLVLAICLSCGTEQQGSVTGSIDKKKGPAGLYKLYISENQGPDGRWHEDPWTTGGDGYLLYDGLGHMAAFITPEGYNDYTWLDEESSINAEQVQTKVDSMSLDELRSAVVHFSSDYVYLANYSIEDTADVVVHDRFASSLPSIPGTKVRRAFIFSGDTLILRILNGNRRLKWIRQE